MPRTPAAENPIFRQAFAGDDEGVDMPAEPIGDLHPDDDDETESHVQIDEDDNVSVFDLLTDLLPQAGLPVEPLSEENFLQNILNACLKLKKGPDMGVSFSSDPVLADRARQTAAA